MAETMDKFLKKTFKQLQFNSMPVEVRKHFYEWIDKGTLTPEMQMWTEDYLAHVDKKDKHSPLKKEDGTYIRNSLPNALDNSDLPEDEARKLFIEFQKAFSLMHAKLGDFERTDPDSAAFCKRYYGTLFKVAAPSDEVKNSIQKLVNLIETDARFKSVVLNQQSGNKPIFKDEDDLNSFLKKCKDNSKLDTDASLQNKIHDIAYALRHDYETPDIINYDVNKLASPNAFAPRPEDINDTDLKKFRQELLVYDSKTKNPKVPIDGLLTTLYQNKTIRDRFAKYDVNDKIVGPVNDALGKVNWHDSKSDNYIAPKYNDQKTKWQRLEDWASNQYSDSLKKYEQLRGGRVFFNNEAKDIFKAIDTVKTSNGKGIKPTDGLKAILDNKDAITKKIDNPLVQTHFNWFVETMNAVKDEIPSAVEGCWRDARFMQAVIGQIILHAVSNDDPTKEPDSEAIKKAKTAMEIMTAMKYGMMTSRTMDALREGTKDFTLFSDSGLSWNKNEGIKFVTTAFDKSVRAAFLGIGYGVTFVRNQIYLRRDSKFTKQSNQKGGSLAEIYQQEQDRLKTVNAEKNRLKADKKQNQLDIKAHKQELDYFKAQGYENSTLQDRQDELNTIEATYLKKYKDGMEKAKAERENAEKIRDSQQLILEEYEQDYLTYQESFKKANFHDVDEQIKLLTDRLTYYEAQINDLKNQKNVLINGNVYANQNEIDEIDNQLQILYNHRIETKTAIETEKKKKDPSSEHYKNEVVPALNIIGQKRYKDANNNYLNAEKAFNLAENDIINADNSYKYNESIYNKEAITSGYKDKKDKIDRFKEATQELKDLNKHNKEYNDALKSLPERNMNKVVELENYWNWLQGNDTKTWRLSTKNAQKDFDKNKQDLWMQYLQQNQSSLAA